MFCLHKNFLTLIEVKISGGFFCARKTCSIIIDIINPIIRGRNQKSKKLDRKNKNSFIDWIVIQILYHNI